MGTDNKEEEKKGFRNAAITVGLISCGLFVAYRLGIKRGYKDAMKTMEGTMDCIIEAFTQF